LTVCAVGPVLPDVMDHDLDIVFCGTAAGAASARKGAYYAGPGNAFWPTLFDVGLIPIALPPRDFASLLRWNMGLTDLVKHASGSDLSLAKDHFDVERLRRLMVEFRPHLVAFTGKRAAREFLGRTVGYGLLPERVGSTRLFVLPSPSGAARGHWDAGYWQQLADERSHRRHAAGRAAGSTSSIPPPCACSSAG
jgi:TDG/mug DNA glycosylase family protein